MDRAYIEKIKDRHACSEAIEWLEAGKYTTLDEAWHVCERGDWMLWLAGKLVGGCNLASRKHLVLTACQCARLALPYVRKGEKRPLTAIETAEAWVRGGEGVTIEHVRRGAHAAADAAYAAADAAADAAYAAHAAADAAYAAYAAADAAYAAADAAAYAAYAAHAHSNTRHKEILGQCADIVREYYPVAPDMN